MNTTLTDMQRHRKLIKNPNLRHAIEDIYSGFPIIIVDDFDRENEGDLMIAGIKATTKNIAFMCRYGRGIMCLPTSGEILDRLEIPMMVPIEDSNDPLETPFTVSVDAIEGITTGVSASDRVKTIQEMCHPESRAADLQKPGHLFPLRARDNLLEDRQGHTEASVALTRMLNYTEVAVISEIMNEDGTMARLPELQVLAAEHQLHIISIEEVIEELGIETSN